MAGEALGVVKLCFVLQIVVWVVTRRATHSRIILEMGPAINDSIRLKTQVIHPTLIRHHNHLLEAHVTGTAELLRQVERVERHRIKDLQVSKVLSLDCCEMLFARPVTRFTADAGDQAVEL